MPPSLPQDSESIQSTEPYYTNEDVAILHDIVIYAQELLPTLPVRERVPTNALFHAYYALLPSIGISADHDSRYARILFKIGGGRSDGSLYQKFEAVLSRMGIEIQFDQENNPKENEAAIDLQSIQKLDSRSYNQTTSEVVVQERGRQRRNSESSAGALEHGYDRQNRPRPRSGSSISKNRYDSTSERPNVTYPTQQTIDQTTNSTLYEADPNDRAREQEENRGVRAWLTSEIENQTQVTRERSVSTHRNLHIHRKSPQGDGHRQAITSTLPPHSMHHRANGLPSQPTELEKQSGLLIDQQYHPQFSATALETLMNIKGTLIRQFRDKNLERQTWYQWHQKALQLREDNNCLELQSRHRDRLVLLRQAFDSWHAALVEQRRKAETEYFFAHLGKRATRARDIYLLTKAITHWAYVAGEEAQRTSAARRHILRIRYFNTWRETTAINELKVRRQVLKKFFCTWQKRQVRETSNSQVAINVWNRTSTKRYFWTWFWGFCEQRAPTWRVDRLQRRLLTSWAAVIRRRKEHEREAIGYFRRGITENFSLSWVTKTRQCVELRCQAKDYRAAHLCRSCLVEWYRSATLFRPQQTMRAEVEARWKRDVMRRWRLRAGQERDAAEIDRSKIMREAWVTWNDRLRCNTVQSHMKSHVLFQGLYKWVLAERLLLVRRILEQRKVQKSLRKIVESRDAIAAKDARYILSAQESTKRRWLRNTFEMWRKSLQVSLRRQRSATDFALPNILCPALTKWVNRIQQVQRLNTWAYDADFYFLSSKALKVWELATENFKRERRRNVYAQFRRYSKVNLAMRAFLKWHQQLDSRISVSQQAAQVYHSRNVNTCVDIFDRWRGRTKRAAEMESAIHHSLLRKYFNAMKKILINHFRSEMQAIEFLEDRLSNMNLKRWSRVALHLRATEHLVVELHEKNLKKRSRKIILHWLQRASHISSVHDGLRGQTASHEDDNNFVYAEMMVSRPKFGEHTLVNGPGRADDSALHTPIPGYLSTPSRKMLRAKAMTRYPSTTPRAPLPTQVEMHLRTQYSGRPLSSFRTVLSRSLLGPTRASSVVGDEMADPKGTELQD